MSKLSQCAVLHHLHHSTAHSFSSTRHTKSSVYTLIILTIHFVHTTSTTQITHFNCLNLRPQTLPYLHRVKPRYLNSFTFHSVGHHLSLRPHLLFLTETQVSGATDSNLYSVPSYFLYPKFHSKAGCCIYVRNDIICSRAYQLDSSEFSTIWLKVN